MPQRLWRWEAPWHAANGDLKFRKPATTFQGRPVAMLWQALAIQWPVTFMACVRCS
jgi:hypothetical protein